MGFDIECIVDIHNYPGEYFCPVCRTLVYPNDAVQSQCTHLYCKPCLTHVANGTKACPYDGYLVTESASKPLVESDKTLAENIGKVKVHCLFFRSGCTWVGTLSECNSHCSVCSFGNSPVICNRCGVQIVHRQVHEHAQSCPGGYEAQQAAVGVVGATASSTPIATTSGEMTTTVTTQVAAPPVPQAQNTQTVVVATPMPGQNSQPPLVVSVGVPTPEQQWYQQQYQQYYQQYPGYQIYQQPPQQYYPIQQQAYQQYQQQPVLVPSQNQSNVHPQAAPQIHPQNQTHLVPQISQQPHLQPQAQQGQPPLQQQITPSVPNYQVNHQLPHPPVRPYAPVPPQTVPPPSHGQVAPHPQAMGMRPAAQHGQVPQYQQPQAHIQPQMNSQLLSQPPPLPQPSNQSHVQVQQQAQSYHTHPQTYPRPPPPQLSQANGPAPLPQGPHPPVPLVSGHHSYPQPQTTQQMQVGLPEQHQRHPHTTSGSLNPLQAPQQPLTMRPPPSLSSLPQQQVSTMASLQSHVPGILPVQNQYFPPHAQQPSHSFQHRPAMQPTQQTVPKQYAQQQPFHAPFHGQSHQQGHFPQQPMQPPRPHGPPPSQQSHNSTGRPIMPNPIMHPQTIPQSSGDMNPGQLGSKQTSINQNNVESTTLEQNTMQQAPMSPPSNRPVGKGFEQEFAKKDATVTQYETVESGGNAANDGLSSIKQEEVGLDSSLEQTSGWKLSEEGTADVRISKEENNLFKNGDTMKQQDLENPDMKMSKVVGGMSSTNSVKQSHMAVSGSSNEGNGLPSKSHTSFQQKPQAQFPAHSPSVPGPQGPGWRELGSFGPPPNNFESHSSNLKPPMNDQNGFIGRAPRPHFEGQFGPQHLARPSGNAVFRDQRSVDGGPVGQIYNNEPSFVRDGGTAPESSMFGLRDEKGKTFAREHFDPFSVEPTQPFNRSLGYTGNASSGQNYDGASKADSGALGPHSRFPPTHNPSVGHSRMGNFGPGSEFGQHHMKHFGPRSPDREYRGISPRGFGGSSIFPQGNSFADINGRDAHGFGEGSRSFNPSSEHGNPFHDGRFPPSSGLLQRGNFDGPGNLRFGDHMAPRPPNNHNRRDDLFGQDGPGHLMRGDFGGPGYFSGHFNTTETAGPGAFHGRMAEFGSRSFSGTMNSYSGQGLPNAATFAGGPDPFDMSRKRRPMSTGWCRICKVDCETVEGLDMHSQTREHQKMAMDMVKNIKQQNKKKQRTSGVHISHDGGRARKVGLEYRGNKP